MTPRSYVWSAGPQPYAARLADERSGFTIMIRRPPPDRLPMDDLLRVEGLAFRWAASTGPRPPAAELFGVLDIDPLRVLQGMNWVLAFWAVLWDLRSGEGAGDVVQRLDYTGPWRSTGGAGSAGNTGGTGSTGGAGGPEQGGMWQAITRLIRTGVIAELTGDPRARSDYDGEVRRLAPDLFIHATLAIMDAFGHELMDRGLEIQGMAAALAEHTEAGDGPLVPFTIPEPTIEAEP